MDNNMKLLHYFPTTRLTEGGTVRAAIDLCTALAERGHDVIWLTTDNQDVPQNWKDGKPNTPRVVLLGSMTKWGNRLSKEQIKLAKTEIAKSDVVHIHAMWMPSNVQIAKACKQVNTPWVLSSHGMLDDWCMEQGNLKKRLYLATNARTMIRNATLILTTAEEERRQASKWIPFDNAIAIPLIVDLAPYKTIPGHQLAQETFGNFGNSSILFLSRVHPKKSIETLIDSAVLLQRRGVMPHFFIAGTGEKKYVKQLQEKVRRCNLEKQFSFLGMVVGEKKLSLYAMADIFALPTQQENFGLVYPEAMLCETPVITTKGTDIWRELKDGGGAMIVDRSPEAFASSIEELLRNDTARIQMGKNARKHILHWLDTNRVAVEYEEMYKSVAT